MRKILTVLLLLMVSTPAYADPSPEEQVLRKAFEGYHAAEAYDEYCNKTSAKERMKNVNMVGNMQMIVARLGGVAKVRNPDLTVETAVRKLRKVADKIKTNTKKVLEAKGCDSEEGVSTLKAYNFYSKVHPGIFYQQLDQEIIKKGGTPTPPLEE